MSPPEYEPAEPKLAEQLQANINGYATAMAAQDQEQALLYAEGMLDITGRMLAHIANAAIEAAQTWERVKRSPAYRPSVVTGSDDPERAFAALGQALIDVGATPAEPEDVHPPWPERFSRP